MSKNKRIRCPECHGDGSHYGMAPHTHNLSKTGGFIGSTENIPEKDWPDNFHPDGEVGGAQGVWVCTKCNGRGTIEQKEQG